MLSDELKNQMIAWYLKEYELTGLDLSWEFKVSQTVAMGVVKEFGVGKSPHRNKNKPNPAAAGFSKPSTKPNIRTVTSRAAYRGHHRRG